MTKSNLQRYAPGTPVTWNWGDKKAHGEIEAAHTRRTTRTIRGTRVTRNATPRNPAYTVANRPRNIKVLKSHTELHETN